MATRNETVGEAFRRLLPANATYDCALPLSFVDNLREVTQTEAGGAFVWLYDGPHALFGRPFPLHNDAIRALESYNFAARSEYPVPAFYRED